MEPDRPRQHPVDPLRLDTVSGASALARDAADALRDTAATTQADTLEELHSAMEEACGRVLDAQPAMAPLVTLVAGVMTALREADDLEAGRSAVADAALAFRDGSGDRLEGVSTRALTALPDTGLLGTVSGSETVRVSLLRWASGQSGPDRAGHARRVLCFESRPGCEGRELARALSEAGLSVTYAVDAAAGRLVPGCAAIVMGADSVGDLGVINKIGSAAVAYAAASAGIPVFILTDTTKILPVGFPQSVEDPRAPHEVWRAPTGVDVWNQYFEPVPLGLVTAIVTEDATRDPTELETARRQMVAPPELTRWATRRESRHRDPSNR